MRRFDDFGTRAPVIRKSPSAGSMDSPKMSLYRNRYFLSGILLILLGLQFRRVESFTLNEQSTRFLAKVTKTPMVDKSTTLGSIFEPVTPTPRKQFSPPRWLRLSMIAEGVVITFHSFSIPKHDRGD